VGPARRRRVRKLAYSVGDAAPHCRAVAIILSRKLIGRGGAFDIWRAATLMLERYGEKAHDDLRYHGKSLLPIGV
jgi:hypothetical protein